MLLTVIHWHCQLLPRTISGANSRAGAELPSCSAGTRCSWRAARAQPEQGESWVHRTQAPKIQDWHTETLCLLASSGPLAALGRWLTPALAPRLQAVPVAEPMPRDPALGHRSHANGLAQRQHRCLLLLEAPLLSHPWLPQPRNGAPQGRHGCAASERLGFPDS